MKKYILILLCSVSIINFSCSSDDTDVVPEIESEEQIYQLAIVVHVIHGGEEVGTGYNLSKARILEQIETLNNDFRKKEGTLGYNTHALGTDAKIEFKLATIAPDGSATDGITRVDYNTVEKESTGGWVFDTLPAYGYWNRDDYINVWVHPLEPNLVLGQASPPQADLPGLKDISTTLTTGIMITSPHFGTTDLEGGANLGRTLTHEMGHFLGLEHLWGKKEKADCMEYDDYCDDTPAVSKRTNNCDGTPPLSCNGEPALTQNYMDYTNDACMNMFTKDQVDRMRFVLENSVVRKSLLVSTGINRE